MASADFGYCGFIFQIMNVFVSASTKSHTPGSHVRKSGCRLQNCRAYIFVLFALALKIVSV